MPPLRALASTSRLLGLLAVAALGACGGGGRFDFDAGLPPIPGDGGLTEEELEQYQRCIGQPPEVDDGLLRAAITALMDTSDGTVELPLNTSGCVRVKRTMAGGVATLFTVTYLRGYTFDPTTYQILPLRTMLADLRRDAGGVLTGGFDSVWELADTESFLEVQLRADPRAARFERTVYDSTTRAVRERRTLERTATDRWRQRRERLVGGTLTVVEDVEVTREDFHGGGGSAAVPCDSVQTAALDTALAEMIAKGTSCLSAGNNGTTSSLAQAFEAWAAATAARRSWSCLADGAGYSGAWDPDNQLGMGPLNIEANPTAGDLQSTLFHELTHATSGGHAQRAHTLEQMANDAVAANDRAAYERARTMLAYTDPVYACEAFCFGDPVLRNPCTCAACLGVRTCDQPCANQGTCRRTDVGTTSVPPYASEAAGAWCAPDNITPTAGQISWYNTLAQCQSMCPSGAATCKSESRSCDPSCK